MLAFLGFLGELFGDANFILKILVLLTIVSYVKNHIQNQGLMLIVFGMFCYFIFFSQLWWLFGGIYVLYMLLALGAAGILIDFFFVSQMGGSQDAEQAMQGQLPGWAGPMSSGADVAKRMVSSRMTQHAAAMAARRPPPMMG